jgi:nucleoside 2-deoxyribosyltransferase/ubiquinone/menaquinone biosynthesis C-methylase UbiE
MERPSRKEKPRIYWANAMFTEADRVFNDHAVGRLRSAGFSLYSPQEHPLNERARRPTPDRIFRIDTREITLSDCLVACLDQETIDSGVACEVGFAVALGTPVLGLYTDIRQDRAGPGRMYKNLYVLGAIERSEGVVATLDAVVSRLRGRFPSGRRDRSPPEETDNYDRVAAGYGSFVTRLELRYRPLWRLEDWAGPTLRALSPHKILEFGCGDGRLARMVQAELPDAEYLGYDSAAAMIEAARAGESRRIRFTSSWRDVQMSARRHAFDLGISGFVFHDLPSPEATLREIAPCLSPGAEFLLADLSTWDLPELTRTLRQALLTPANAADPRLSAESVHRVANAAGMEVVAASVAMPRVTFPSFPVLREYLVNFGIPEGSDLPLGIRREGAAAAKRSIGRCLRRLAYPFEDTRAFLLARMRRTARR